MQYSRIQNTFITYQAIDVFSVDESKSPAVNVTLVEKKQVQLNSNRYYVRSIANAVHFTSRVNFSKSNGAI